MVEDLSNMCEHYYARVKKAKETENMAQDIMLQKQMQDDPNSNKDVIYYDDSVSMLERTAFKLTPIIREVVSKMVQEEGKKEEKRDEEGQ